MNNPAFLIDGFTEKLILEKICPNKRVNRINCNGNSVSIEALSKRICTLIRLLNNRHYPIIVIIDREDRDASCQEIEQELRSNILSAGINDDIRIGVCDRMIENWMLADWKAFSETCEIKKERRPETIDGIMGKSIIKKLYPAYHETTDGVNLFIRSNPTEIYSNSQSFKTLADKLKDIECPWLNRFS